MELTEENLRLLIEELAEIYKENYGCADARGINQGFCVEFASDLSQLTEDSGYLNHGEIEIVSEDYLKFYGDVDGEWDIGVIEEDFHSKVPQGLTIEALNGAESGYHTWIEFRGKFYDAECKSGAANLFDLPFYKRFADKLLQRQ